MIYYLRNNHKELPEQTGKYVSILYCEKCDVYNWICQFKFSRETSKCLI